MVDPTVPLQQVLEGIGPRDQLPKHREGEGGGLFVFPVTCRITETPTNPFKVIAKVRGLAPERRHTRSGLWWYDRHGSRDEHGGSLVR